MEDDGPLDTPGDGMDRIEAESLLAAVPMPLVLIGGDARILAANAAGRALLGARQVGRHHAIALRQPGLLSLVDSALKGGGGGESGYEIATPSGRARYLVTVTPVRNGRQRGVICAFRDMIEQSRADEFRRDFIANASHELRTPLTALNGIIETLRGPAKDDPAARERFLATMQDEVQRMTRLVRDFLALSRAEAGEGSRPEAMVDVAGLAASVTGAMRPLADDAGMRLELDIRGTVPPVPGDADQLAQVLRNLVENAINYGRPGERVTVALGPSGDMLRIDVTDRGEGIAPEHLPRLTERFYRVDRSRSRSEGGTGLGLAIVKHIVNRHRGRLAINSALGKGTTVSVILPRS